MENNSQKKINILEIIKIFLSYWLLIGISVAFFVALGMFYMRYASKTYSVYARIAINMDEVQTNRGSSNYVNVSDLMTQEKTFTNEITYLQSTPLIREVIDEMNLFTSYYVKEDKIPKELPFSFYNIYKNSPFIVLVDEEKAQPMGVMFYLRIIDDERFVINAFEPDAYLYYPETETSSNSNFFFHIDGTYRFGETINNNYCSFKILLNSNYNAEQYQGNDLFFKFNSPVGLSYRFQDALTIRSAFYESSIADLTFEWENLELAKDFLSLLIDKYIEKNLDKKNYNANNTIDYINRQLSTISGSLGQSERQLQNFRVSQDVMNINEKSTSIYGQRQTLELNRDDIESRVQYLTRLNNYFEQHKDSSTFIAPSFMGMSDVTLANLIQELTNLSTERQNLISTNQLKNPRIKTLDATISNIKNVIADNIAFNLSATLSELEDINRRIAELDGEISRLPQTQRQLIGLEREFNLNDAVYTSLLDKRIQAQIIKASNVSDCEIIEPVRYQEVSSPSIKMVGVISLFLGVFFPSVYIVLINFLSPKIRTSEELGRFNDLKVIGSIPHNDKKTSNVVQEFPSAPISEKFLSIRTNIVYYLMGETGKLVLVTSTLPNEGKSFTAMNIAQSFAASNSKTILVDFDLRKPSKLFEPFNGKGKDGLSSYLINQVELNDIIIPTKSANLDFMSCGIIPPDPIALLSSSKTAELFTELKKKYDYVIVDTPPFGLVTDSFLLMQYADLSLYVSRLGVITKKPLRLSMEELANKKIENIYLVRNDTTKVDDSYTYKYSYAPKKQNFLKRIFRRKKKEA